MFTAFLCFKKAESVGKAIKEMNGYAVNEKLLMVTAC